MTKIWFHKIKSVLSISALLLLLSFSRCENEKVEIVETTEFKWKVVIPEGFDAISNETWDKIEEIGVDAIEKVHGENIEGRPITNFVYKQGPFQTFESNIQPFNLSQSEDYYQSCLEVNDMVYSTFDETISHTKIDSLFSKVKIDGLDFYRFEINIELPDGQELNTVSYNRLFGQTDLTINILYMDDNVGKELIQNINNSKFY